jgi:hypothetical protein
MPWNIFAIPSLITFIVALVLSIFVLIKNPKREVNILLSIFLFIISIWSFGELFIRLAGKNQTEALFWHQLVILSGGFMPAIFLHFSLIFPKKSDFINKYFYFIVPTIYIFRFLVFIPKYFIPTETDFLVYTSYGYYSQISMLEAVYGSNSYSELLLLISLISVGIYILAGLLNLFLSYIKTKIKIEKIQVRLILIGSTFFLGLGFLTNILLPSFGFVILELGSIIFLISAVIFFYAILKYNLMSIELISEPIETVPIDYEVEPGYTYIIPESEPKLGFQLFAKTMSEGVHGICITMRNPKLIRNKYGLKNTPIIWITKYETAELSVKPSDIASINEILKPFLEKSSDSVILLIDDKTITSGIQVDGHTKIIELSKKFFDTVVTSKSRFLISVSPNSISRHKRGTIIKTKSPLLEFTRLTTFVFEEISNNIIQFLIRNGYLTPKKINEHLSNLRRKDPFFNNIRFRKPGNPITVNNKLQINKFLIAQRLSKQILIDKIKVFISEFENIETAMDLNSIVLDSIAKYGLSRNEFQLHIGDTYIILEAEPRKSYEIFSEFIYKDFKGLCITKSNPKKLPRKYSIFKKGVKVYWLTDIPAAKKEVLPPKLEHILSAIEEFLAKDQDKKIILLDGIEYLIFYSGDIFDAVLSFLRQLTDRVSEANALLLIPLDQTVLSDQRMSLLTRSGMEIYRPD